MPGAGRAPIPPPALCDPCLVRWLGEQLTAVHDRRPDLADELAVALGLLDGTTGPDAVGDHLAEVVASVRDARIISADWADAMLLDVYEDVLEAIVGGHPDPKTLARIALTGAAARPSPRPGDDRAGPGSEPR